MMKKIFFLLSVSFSLSAASQGVSIGSTVPDPSAILDLTSTSKGLLIPRMSTTTRNNILNPAKGLLVMDTTINQLMVFFGSSPTDWRTVVYNSEWSLTGNSNLNPATNFIGTTDNNPIQFRINNLHAGQLHPVTGNVYMGLKAGQNNTTGFSNVGLGRGALFNSTNRNNTVAIGDSALYNNGLGVNYSFTSIRNTAIGSKALYTNTAGAENTASGFQGLFSNTIGSGNTCIGVVSLFSNTEGSNNTANGSYALYANTVGNYNTANGSSALSSNITGSQNTANGSNALDQNIDGTNNVATGYWALFNNTIGSYNTANGSQALLNNTEGYFNTAIGYQALYNNTTGYYNTAMGHYALANNTTGVNNVAIGYGSGTFAGYFNNTISIGNIGYLNAASGQAFLGNLSTTWNGGNQTWSTFSDARMKTNINDDVKGLDFITRLRPVTYYRNIKAATEITGNKETEDFPGKYDVEKRKESGFLAQEVEQAAKVAGYDFSGITIPQRNTELYTLSYEQFVVPLVKAVQEQQAIIDRQQKNMEEQNRKIDLLIKKLDLLKEQLQKQAR